jgi:fructokinase
LLKTAPALITMSATKQPTIAAIEAGGTKFVVAVGRDIGNSTRHSIPTTSPVETLSRVARIINDALSGKSLNAMGVASFGPLCVDPTDPRYGVIGATPKPGWQGFNLKSHLHALFGCPIAFDTDVNSAACAEARWALDKPIEHLAYVTVGTGIGVGVIQKGQLANGAAHPEIGHSKVARSPYDTTFPGACTFHHDCLEGLASGQAIMKRWNCKLTDLPPTHEALALEAFYLGQLAANLILHHQPKVIIFGGGVTETPHLLAQTRRACRAALGGYLPDLDSECAMERVIQSPRLGTDSGIVGAFMLGQQLSISPEGA